MDRKQLLQDLIDSRFGGSQAEFARVIKRSPAQVNQWLSGHRALGGDGARRIELSLGLPAGYFDDPATRRSDAANNVVATPVGSHRVPLISYVQAGLWTEITDPYTVGDAAEWLLTDLELSTSAFALKIKGESMHPDFRAGDVVIIDPNVEPLPGDFVVAKNGDHEATFKKYRPRGTNENGDTIFELVPLNEDYPSMRSDTELIRIIGTMVEHRRYRKR